MPAILVGLTALVTGAMVHAGFGLWWLLENFLFRGASAYDWAGALVVSGPAATIVLLAGLLARRLVAGNPHTEALTPVMSTPALPARVSLGADR